MKANVNNNQSEEYIETTAETLDETTAVGTENTEEETVMNTNTNNVIHVIIINGTEVAASKEDLKKVIGDLYANGVIDDADIKDIKATKKTNTKKKLTKKQLTIAGCVVGAAAVGAAAYVGYRIYKSKKSDDCDCTDADTAAKLETAVSGGANFWEV